MPDAVLAGSGANADSRRVLLRNAVTVRGPEGAPVLVFGHGYGTDQSIWSAIAERFIDEYRVVLFDYVGSGASDIDAYDPARYDSFDGYASDIIEVLDALGLRQVSFIAHSASGMISAVAAIRRPDLFARLIMLCPSPCYVDDGDYRGGFSREDVLDLLAGIDANQPSWAATLAPAMTARADLPEVSDRVRRHLATAPHHVAKHFARVVFLSDMRHRLADVGVPCVVMQPSGDIICPPHIGVYLRDHLRDCKLIELDSSGHFVHLTEPELVTGHIRASL